MHFNDLYNKLSEKYSKLTEPYGDGTDRVSYYQVIKGVHQIEVVCRDDGGMPLGSSVYDIKNKKIRKINAGRIWDEDISEMTLEEVAMRNIEYFSFDEQLDYLL